MIALVSSTESVGTKAKASALLDAGYKADQSTLVIGNVETDDGNTLTTGALVLGANATLDAGLGAPSTALTFGCGAKSPIGSRR